MTPPTAERMSDEAVALDLEQFKGHTPGPWKISGADGNYGYAIHTPDGKSFVAVWPTSADGTRFPCTENARLIAAAPELLRLVESLQHEIADLRRDAERMDALINTPHTDEWFEAVRFEAAHQIERWGADHDAGKQPHDWFWLLGYLGGKALASALRGDTEKAKHHTISSGAMLLNWFRAMTGDSNLMRPGIDDAALAANAPKVG